MAIAIGDTSSAQGTNVSSRTFAHDVAGSDTLLVVAVVSEQTNASAGNLPVTGITYNGDALTKIDADEEVGASDTDRSELWYRLNPDPGTANVIVSLTGQASGLICMAATFTGVKQQAPDASAKANNTGTSCSASTTPLAADSLVIAVGCNGSAANSFTLDSGNEILNLSEGGIIDGGFAYKSAGASSTTISWTLGASSRWAEVIAAFAPQVTATANPSFLMNFI